MDAARYKENEKEKEAEEQIKLMADRKVKFYCASQMLNTDF